MLQGIYGRIIAAHLWWRVEGGRVRIQVSRREFHAQIHLKKLKRKKRGIYDRSEHNLLEKTIKVNKEKTPNKNNSIIRKQVEQTKNKSTI